MSHTPQPARRFPLLAAIAVTALVGACASAAPEGEGRVQAEVPVSACADLTPERPAGASRHLREQRRLMGTAFQIRLVTADRLRGCAAIGAAFDEVSRQEELFSEYKDTSEVSAINRAAGQSPIEVDPEVFGLIQRAAWVSTVTKGAFDISFASCGRLWSIRDQRVPSDQAVAACLQHVGYRNIRLDERGSSVFLPAPEMRIGLGGIAKGYGVDRAADVLRERGFSNFVVDGGGDMRVEGEDIDGPWTVHIAHPRRPGEVFDTLRMTHGAIVTSGDYLRYFERDGVRYHHILDPATGFPARRSVSVTVTAPTATDADGLATGLFVLGPDRGLAALAALPGVEALYFAPDLTVRASKGFPRGTHTGWSDQEPGNRQDER